MVLLIIVIVRTGDKTDKQVSYEAPEQIDLSSKSPGLFEDTKTKYYRIYGYTPAQLAKQIEDCGPKIEGYPPSSAFTDSRVNWLFSSQPTDSGCKITDVIVGVSTVLYYPEWQAEGTIEDGLEQKWQETFPEIKAHEEGHRQLNLDAGREIASTLPGLTSSTCEGGIELGQNTANQIMDKYRQQSKEYDEQTNYGRKEGAEF